MNFAQDLVLQTPDKVVNNMFEFVIV